MCDRREERLEHWGRRYPAIETDGVVPRGAVDDDRVEAVVIATPVSTHFELASRALQFGKHVFVEKPLAAQLRGGGGARAARAPRRTRADAGPHVPLQPSGRARQGADRPRRPGRDLLRLVEPRQPRPAPAGRERRLGSRPARLLDPALLARRVARARSPRCQPRLRRSRARPTSRSSTSRTPRARSPRSSSRGSRRASCGGPRSSARSGWSSTTTRAASRCACSTPGRRFRDPESFGEYQLSYRTGDIVSPRVEPVEPLFRQMEDFCAAVRDGTQPRSSATIGLEVVEVVEAVDRSLGDERCPGRCSGVGPCAWRGTRRLAEPGSMHSSNHSRRLVPARSGLEGPSRSMLGLMLVADGHEVRTEPWA